MEITDIPDNRIFRVLEDRKNYLSIRNENKRSSYIQYEIKALEKIVNFSKLILNNLPVDLIETAIKEREPENAAGKQLKETDEINPAYSYEINMTEDYKLAVSFIGNDKGNKYISIEPSKYIENKHKWEKRGKYRITVKIMEDIIKKSNEIGAERPCQRFSYLDAGVPCF